MWSLSLSVSLVTMCVVASVPPGTGGQCWGHGDTGDHWWPGGGGTWGHSHMVTWSPPGPGDLERSHSAYWAAYTNNIASHRTLQSKTLHYGCNTSTCAGYAWWYNALDIHFVVKMFMMYRSGYIQIVCVELWNWKVSLVICNWNLAYFLIRSLHHTSISWIFVNQKQIRYYCKPKSKKFCM